MSVSTKAAQDRSELRSDDYGSQLFKRFEQSAVEAASRRTDIAGGLRAEMSGIRSEHKEIFRAVRKIAEEVGRMVDQMNPDEEVGAADAAPEQGRSELWSDVWTPILELRSSELSTSTQYTIFRN